MSDHDSSWNSVPKGIFDNVSLMWGLNFGQALMMCGVGIAIMVLMLLFEALVPILLIIFIVVEFIMFNLFRTANSMSKGAMLEQYIYKFTAKWNRKRYSGRLEK